MGVETEAETQAEIAEARFEEAGAGVQGPAEPRSGQRLDLRLPALES